MNPNLSDLSGYNRRDFLKSGSFASLMTMMGGIELFAESTPASKPEAAPIGGKMKVAVIGLGSWGRDILAILSKLENAEIAALCDTYGAYVRRSSKYAPQAKQIQDYKTVLDNNDIKAVIVATPTHKHKEIVLAALKAGKHVYCEAPMANTIEDAREIALAAKAAAKKQIFQVGLQMRSDPQRGFLLPFIRSGALGKFVVARAQSHKKQSWRTASPDSEQEKALNWRLSKATSTGLIGEMGIHQVDQASWFLNSHPISVTGFNSLIKWTDGRDVPDTVQAVLEYPGGVRLMYDCTIANSFDADYELYHGTDAAVMLRESKAWMFKEVDSPLLGWEVYAKKDIFFKQTGIALAIGSSKQTSFDAKTEDVPYVTSTLKAALGTFLRNSIGLTAAEEDFVSNYGKEDTEGLLDHLTKFQRDPAAGYLEGFESTVTVIKANEAVNNSQKMVFKREWYELG
jgi:predicted dehydrogenase